jgi:hypothetical protein
MNDTEKSILLIQSLDGRMLINPAHCTHTKRDYAMLPGQADDGRVIFHRVEFCLDCRLVITPFFDDFFLHSTTVQQAMTLSESGEIPVGDRSRTG